MGSAAGPPLLLAALLAALAGGARADAVPVWPAPAHATTAPGCLKLWGDRDGVQLRPRGAAGDLPVLVNGIARYQDIIKARPCAAPPPAAACEAVARGGVAVWAESHDETLDLSTNETYNLTLDKKAGTIVAATPYGALRAMETLSQLVQCTTAGEYIVEFAEVVIDDAPRFRHRGLMIDTGRSFLPMPYIRGILDAMAYNKLNVLHWHLMDSESFPFNSTALPKLVDGAFSPASVYQPDDLRDAVEFARQRGIRIIPEIDMPGHAVSWGKGYPDLLTECSPDLVAPLDVTKNATLSAVGKLMAEIADIFPDAQIHVGGDEVASACWLENKDVQKFMAEHNLNSGADLQSYFEQQVLKMAEKLGRSAIVWEEAFLNWPDGTPYPPNMVVEPWRSGLPKPYDVLEKALKAGLRTVYTSREWYLDYVLPREACTTQIGNDWHFAYTFEPLPKEVEGRLTAQEAANFMGAEVAMWAPFTDTTNTFQTIFPRSSAVAEKLWSPAAATQKAEPAEGRLQDFRCLMLARGVPSGPSTWGKACPADWQFDYNPPYRTPQAFGVAARAGLEGGQRKAAGGFPRKWGTA